MQNLFGIDMTKGQETDVFNIDRYTTVRVDPAHAEALDTTYNGFEDMKGKAALPPVFGIAKTVAWIGFLILILGVLKSGASLAEGYRNAPVIFWLIPVLFAIWLTLVIVERRRAKQVVESDGFADALKAGETLTRESERQLGVPEGAASIDVLAEGYVMKNGVPVHRDAGLTTYVNCDVYAFTEHGCLVLADLRQRWELPLTGFVSLEPIKKLATFPEWHKALDVDDKSFKPYHVKRFQYGYSARYHRAVFHDAGRDWYLLIPDYDVPTFRELTGLHEA
ncbi:MAG: hypothetical protein IKI21_06550 [Oscillospiraceae bacterium]|nr:hypothetical protein [Oscillospiraceae bacterium]